MASVANIMSTWPIPEGTPGVYAAVGTTGTCTAQGFFGEVGNVTTPTYNCMLCIYYMLIIRSGWSETKIRKIEPFLHVIPLVVGLTMGIAGLPLTLYNPSGWLCWYAPYPGNCLNDPDVPCERGELAHIFRWVHYGIIWSAIFFVTVGMFLIYRKVHDNEAKTQRFTRFVHPEDEDTRPKRRISFINRQEEELRAQQVAAGRSRKVANQAMLFVGALYLTWIFTTVSFHATVLWVVRNVSISELLNLHLMILRIIGGTVLPLFFICPSQLTRIFQIVQGKSHYPLLVLMGIFFPLQGFFNSIIYLRPRYLKEKEKNPERSFVGNCRAVIRTKDNLETRDNTDFSASTLEKRRSFVSKISCIVESGARRLSALGTSGMEADDQNENDDVNGNEGSDDLRQGANVQSNDDDSFIPEEDLKRLEEAAEKAASDDSPRRNSVTFSGSVKKFDGSAAQQK